MEIDIWMKYEILSIWFICVLYLCQKEFCITCHTEQKEVPEMNVLCAGKKCFLFLFRQGETNKLKARAKYWIGGGGIQRSKQTNFNWNGKEAQLKQI